MSFLWLLLQILPLLLVVAALFFWLGLRQPRADLSAALEEKKADRDREQERADTISRQLTMAEEQINELTASYERLQRSAVPRRLLSDAENEIIKLQRELAAFRPSPEPEAPPVSAGAFVQSPETAPHLEPPAEFVSATPVLPPDTDPLFANDPPEVPTPKPAKGKRRRRS